MRPLAVAALLAAAALSCREQPRRDPRPAAAVSAPAAPALPGGPTATIVRCGWGSERQGPEGDSPPWLIALVDVDAKVSLPGLSVVGAELMAAGKPITRIGAPPGIRVQQGPPIDSLAAVDTSELRGALPGGLHRLRIGTRLEGQLVDLQGQHPDRCRVVLSDETGRTLAAEGKLDPAWEPPARAAGAGSSN